MLTPVPPFPYIRGNLFCFETALLPSFTFGLSNSSPFSFGTFQDCCCSVATWSFVSFLRTTFPSNRCSRRRTISSGDGAGRNVGEAEDGISDGYSEGSRGDGISEQNSGDSEGTLEGISEGAGEGPM